MKLAETMKWFDMWYEDKASILDTMVRNMISDLDAGYDPMGHCIKKQRVDIEEYQMDIDKTMDMFKTMEDKAVNRWCYYDMKKRGAI